MKKRKLLKQLLNDLRDSCEQGLDGTWDCSTDEGKEGFGAMSEACDKIAHLIGVELKPYKTKK